MLERKMEGEDPVLEGADGEEELLVLSPVPSSISLIIRVLRKEVGGLMSVISFAQGTSQGTNLTTASRRRVRIKTKVFNPHC